ncbi:hypothetical protein FB451DRAFT_1399312 [Mycena latifolia]|nr:hypothetical protein FB451DRAFT_1399312 [Mycena latifolia]
MRVDSCAGGPGESGTGLASPEVADLLGDDWDLLGFDPRGIKMTLSGLEIVCTTDYDFFVANTVLQQGFTVASSSNLSNPALEQQLVEQAREFLVLKQSQAELCAKNMGNELRYMGTATVVRDMDFMAKFFDGEDDKINYWAGSYGSILGAYLVNMLPARAGFVVIDAIVDPVSWSTEPSHKWPINWLASAEKTIVSTSKPAPRRWAGNGTLLFNQIAKPFPASHDLARTAVTCLDAPPPTSPADMPTAEDLAAEMLETMRAVSPQFGASTSRGEPDGGCEYWPVRGPERFTGPFNASLAWPMLVNPYYIFHQDGPSGLRINALMPNSTRMIIQDGPGMRGAGWHGSVSVPTLCTIKLVRGYFAGTLPENGTVCETAYEYFPDPSSETPALLAVDAEDEKLLESAQAVARILWDVRGG